MHRIFCALPLLAALAIAQEAIPGRGINFYSIEKEIALGRQLAAEFQRNHQTFVSPATQTYIDDLGHRLAAQSANSVFTYTFALTSDDPTLLHEPAAFPGGFIFIPARLILAARDEDELAGIIAHAIAHVEARHGTKQATRAEIARITTIQIGTSAGSAMIRDVALPRRMLALQRTHEIEADRIALHMMSAAGYDPAALARYLEREQQPDPSLPRIAERLAALQTAAQNLPARAYEPHPAFESIQAEVRRLTGR